MQLAVNRCRDVGLEPVFHHHLGTDVETEAETERLLELTDVAVCLDTGHLTLAGGDPVEAVRRWAGRIGQVHLKDADLAAHHRIRAAGGGLTEVVAGGRLLPPRRGRRPLRRGARRPGRHRLHRLAGDRAGRARAGSGPRPDPRRPTRQPALAVRGGPMTEPGKRIRIAVAGLGVIARTVHLPLLQRRSDLFEIVALSDLSPARVAELGHRYGVEPGRRYADAATMLTDGGHDAVLLAISGSHGELAALALRSGVPVLCEKPLAYTLAEAARLTEVSAGTPALMVGYMKQYDPAVAEAARLLEEIGGAPRVHAVEVTVLHAGGDRQLEFANLPPDPQGHAAGGAGPATPR
ncbi:Gfo/Idh/MocA family oxidoreductase [Micromonospora sp. ATA32]|nr:Gfo/Idh/MocA family oxidoreductase [Micromonospora sp. ATA32]